MTGQSLIPIVLFIIGLVWHAGVTHARVLSVRKSLYELQIWKQSLIDKLDDRYASKEMLVVRFEAMSEKVSRIEEHQSLMNSTLASVNVSLAQVVTSMADIKTQLFNIKPDRRSS